MKKYTIKSALDEIAEDFCIEDFIDENLLLKIRDEKYILKPNDLSTQELISQMKEFIDWECDEDVAEAAKKATDKQILIAIQKHIEMFAEDYQTEEEMEESEIN